MKEKIERIIYHTCAYALIISVLFFAFAKISGMKEVSISFGRYLLIILFALLISFSELLFKINSIPKVLCYVIHFSVLFLAFLIVFLVISNSKVFEPSYIFSSLAIFSVTYLLTFLIIFLVKQLTQKSERKTAKKGSNKAYTPRFKDD